MVVWEMSYGGFSQYPPSAANCNAAMLLPPGSNERIHYSPDGLQIYIQSERQVCGQKSEHGLQPQVHLGLLLLHLRHCVHSCRVNSEESLELSCLFSTKGGHPILVSTSAILLTTKLIAELRTKKSCGTAIVDLQNLTSATLCSLQPVALLLVPFPLPRML
jgi:hypothetical protein